MFICFLGGLGGGVGGGVGGGGLDGDGDVDITDFLALLAAWPVDAALPETSSSYEIDVRIDPETHELSGSERIVWTNPSPQMIDTLHVHLYLNGFAHEGTTWMRESYPDASDRPGWQERYDDPWGHIEPRTIVQLTADGVPDLLKRGHMFRLPLW